VTDITSLLVHLAAPGVSILRGKAGSNQQMSHGKPGHSSVPPYVIWLIAGSGGNVIE
jgi:hypothetical protein